MTALEKKLEVLSAALQKGGLTEEQAMQYAQLSNSSVGSGPSLPPLNQQQYGNRTGYYDQMPMVNHQMGPPLSTSSGGNSGAIPAATLPQVPPMSSLTTDYQYNGSPGGFNGNRHYMPQSQPQQPVNYNVNYGPASGSPNDGANQAGYASDVSSAASTTPTVNGRKLYKQPKDAGHPSLDGTPEELEADAAVGPVDTGVDIGAIKAELMESWNKVVERSSRRLELLENQPVQKIPTYETDVVSQGVITVEEAEKRINIYRTRFYEVHPLVLIPELPLDEFRKEYPTLFLTVMSITSLVMEANDLDKFALLQNKAMETLVYTTMVVGQKSFELLQCAVLLTFWYNDAEVQCHQKYHLLSNLAVSIAIDLGLNGSVFDASKGYKYEKILRPQALVDPKTIECRRLWLCVYCCTINFTIVVRRPMYSLWSSYMEECCEVIENSDLPVREKRIVQYAQMTHLFEEISRAFMSESGKPPPDVEDSKTKFILRYFERQLIDLYEKSSLPRLEPYFNAIQIHIHQAALYVPLNSTLGRSPFSEYSLALGMKKCTPEVVNCSVWCFASCTKCLDLMVEMSIEDLSTMPMFTYTRIIFCVAMLLKLRSLSLTSTEFSKVCPMNTTSLNRLYGIQSKLDELVNKYPFCNPAVTSKFVINLLLFHFDRQVNNYLETIRSSSNNNSNNNNKPINKRLSMAGGSKGLSPSMDNDNDQQKRRSSSANPKIPGSPLEILSSVAVSGSQDNSQTAANPNGNMCQQQQQQPPTANEDLDPNWLLTDDFWKDVVPNVEAFMGYDIM